MEIKVYYNDVVLGDNAIVKPNCPSIKLPIEEAKKYAEEKVSSGEWTAYLIPDLHHGHVQYIEGDIY